MQTQKPAAWLELAQKAVSCLDTTAEMLESIDCNIEHIRDCIEKHAMKSEGISHEQGGINKYGTIE